MKKLALLLSLSLALLIGHQAYVHSHCEIPCGIYGDSTRIALLMEDIATVEKSMKQMDTLVKEDPINVNQIIRWTNNKETHANNIQHVVTQYFMTQRVKPKTDADGDEYKKYVGQLTTLHNMLIHAMKAKQTTDTEHCTKLRELVHGFSEMYFSKEDLEHLKEHLNE